MAKYFRKRETIGPPTKPGKKSSYGSVWEYGSSSPSQKKVTLDYVNSTKPYLDGDLGITSTKVIPLRIYGSTPTASTKYDGYNPSYWTNADHAGDFPTSVDWGFFRTKAIAGLDPWSTKVDLPLFLFELKDMPKMLLDVCKLLTLGQFTDDMAAGWSRLSKFKSTDWGELPGSFLSYRFGWAPIVKDIVTYFDLAKSIDDRMRYFRRLETKQRVRRTLFDGQTLDRINRQSPGGYVVKVGTWKMLTADIREQQHLKVWFTARAKLVDPLPNDGVALRSLSKDILLGLTRRPASVWEYIPWTWLIDYFANVGEYMRAWEALTRVRVSNMNIMAHQVSSRSLTNFWLRDGLTCSSPAHRVEQKLRRVYTYPLPKLAFDPFLNNGQMAVLGALASAKTLKALTRGRK